LFLALFQFPEEVIWERYFRIQRRINGKGMFQLKKTGVNILLSFASLMGGLLFVIILMRIFVGILGLDVKEIACCLPRPDMWIEDGDAGYRNKPFLTKRVFGNILGVTNSRGFRSFQEFSQDKNRKTLRIVGIGDSVMWGNKANLEDTFMGRLEKQLAKKYRDVEVINCGVVGYSTFQEKVFYEKFIVNMRPDIVFINFCSNDWLPTEDPYGNLRQIYVNYLEEELGKHSSHYTVPEQKLLKLIIRKFSGKEKVWSAFWKLRENKAIEPVLRKALLERPIQQMANVMRKNKTSLIYLFIPDTFPNEETRQTVSDLQGFMKRKNIRYIDLSDQLIEMDKIRDEYSVKSNGKIDKIIEFFSEIGIFGIFRFKYIEAYNPIENMRRILQYRLFWHRQHHVNYIDTISHLSIKGHEIVANRITAYLGNRALSLQGNVSP
jgi:hypothetical protein